MEGRLIPEPQRSHILELLKSLGPAADAFVLAGAQAMKFVVEKARATKDFDFILDVVTLRSEKTNLASTLEKLGYRVVEGAQNFQFEKNIPDSAEVVRVEFMGPAEQQRQNDFRVDVQEGVHARACTGGRIVLAESDLQPLSGRLSDGSAVIQNLRVTRSHALVMLKCLAMDDRYRNIRGASHARHDRDEARVHATDIVAILSAQKNLGEFQEKFRSQFTVEPELGIRVGKIADDYFKSVDAPGLLLYEEFLVENTEAREDREQVERELGRALGVLKYLTTR
ncbi:MAG: hypothetical protein DMG38_00620 [Acidobacteria bacterium]|nr:MAG: hypothetical protein DMG38_00620 [Acidobacteriota bacterium]